MPETRNRRLFEPGEALQAARVRLGPASVGDIEAMPWLEAALEPYAEPADLLPHIAKGEAASVWMGETAIGLAVALVGQPCAGAAAVPFIGIEPAERFRGLGGEAGLALERWLVERAGVERVLAAVPESRGLAVYFWLRLGYRPMLRVDAPWPLAGLDGKPAAGIWMGRETGL